jgi:hypothetical protein
MLLRMLTATIRRVEEHSRRRIWPGKRAIVTHIRSCHRLSASRDLLSFSNDG